MLLRCCHGMAPCYGRLTHMGNEKTTCTRSLGEEIAKLQSFPCFLPGLQHVPHCTERSRRAAESDPLLQNSKAWNSKKADSTLRSSQAVPHPSTDRALRCLTSEVKRDPVHSTRYGRQRKTSASAAEKCTKKIAGIACAPWVFFHPKVHASATQPCNGKSWQHPKVFPGSPPPQY